MTIYGSSTRENHNLKGVTDSHNLVVFLATGALQDYLEVDKDWTLVKTTPPRFLVGIPLGESHLRARYHVTVVSVKPEGNDEFTYADFATTLRYGDQILVVGKARAVERFVDEI